MCLLAREIDALNLPHDWCVFHPVPIADREFAWAPLLGA